MRSSARKVVRRLRGRAGRRNGAVKPGASEDGVVRDEAHHLEDRRQDRLTNLFGSLELNGSVLEVGPGRVPMAPKRLGYDVTIVDRVDAAALRDRYVTSGVEDPQVEEVDIVWTGDSIAAAMDGRRFDYVIASHVAEHVPDLVAFLTDLSALLAPNGKLGLVLPQKVATFDVRRPSSTVGQVIDAHVAERKRPSAGAVAEHFLYASDREGRNAWAADDHAPLAWTHTIDEARSHVRRAIGGEYLDVHVWSFEPAEFDDVLHRLRQLELIDLASSPSVLGAIGEYYCVLRHPPT